MIVSEKLISFISLFAASQSVTKIQSFNFHAFLFAIIFLVANLSITLLQMSELYHFGHCYSWQIDEPPSQRFFFFFSLFLSLPMDWRVCAHILYKKKIQINWMNEFILNNKLNEWKWQRVIRYTNYSKRKKKNDNHYL